MNPRKGLTIGALGENSGETYLVKAGQITQRQVSRGDCSSEPFLDDQPMESLVTPCHFKAALEKFRKNSKKGKILVHFRAQISMR
jgi:hypothetical protein